MASINEGHLIGLWPLTEPSGSPVFHNYAGAYGGKPSGISYDLHVAVTNNADINEPRSIWPGSTSFLNPESGVTYVGYKVQGTSDRTPNDSGPLEKILVLGHGAFQHRRAFIGPSVAQSGFTVGFWVNPQSDGYDDIAAASMTNELLAEAHALVAMSDASNGFIIGVSGRMSQGAQFNSNANNKQLTAYAHVLQNAPHLSIPIESGRYTHLTFTYRFVSAGNHQAVLYKDGRVAASGNTSSILTNATANFVARNLTVGGSQTTSTLTGRYDNATGWGHLVSGLYAFSRVLPEGEILSMHNAGGLQPKDGIQYKTGKEILITDSSLIGYYPGLSVGYVDASKNHNALMAEGDEGNTQAAAGEILPISAPFGRAGFYNNGGGTTAFAVVAGSGITNSIISSKSFTIAGWFIIPGTTTIQSNTLFSFGSIGTTTEAPALSFHTAGFRVSSNSASSAVRVRAQMYEGGNPFNPVSVSGNYYDIQQAICHHITYVYDDQTFGMSLYIDGELAQSGTMSSSVIPQFQRLAASGFPFVFLNGVQDSNPETFVAAAGLNAGVSDLAIFGRPLLANEIIFLTQSGINLSKLQYTVQDPRLRGYWKGTEAESGIPVAVQDRARVWENMPLNLTRALSDAKWSVMQTSDNKGPFYKIDMFGKTNTIPAALTSFGSLGLTSGVWTPAAGSPGNQAIATETNRHSSIAAPALRFKPSITASNVAGQYFNEAYIVCFEVTPSGTIPSTFNDESRELNSLIFHHGNGTDRFMGFLTSINANGSPENAASSGISIVFQGRKTNAAGITPLVSGNIPYGVPSRIGVYIKPEFPYFFSSPASLPLSVSLYINGVLTHRREVTNTSANIWSASTPVTANDVWILEWGGRSVDDVNTNAVASDCGLGNCFIRNMFIVKGILNNSDVLQFVTSGIYDNSDVVSNGYTDAIPTNTVTVANPNLKGYYRFTGANSGIDDLSIAHNNLTNLANQVATSPGFASSSNAAFNLRWVPGPMTFAAKSLQASGITYEGASFTAANAIAPFAVSGTAFNSPHLGFSVGFLLAKRASVSVANDASILVSYGRVPDTSQVTSFSDSSWAIMIDDTDSVKLVLSKNGTMYYDGSVNLAKSATVEIGASRLSNSAIGAESYKLGVYEPGHSDSWERWIWTVDPPNQVAKCYKDGMLIDSVTISTSGFNTPLVPETKIISFLVPQTGIWTWGISTAAFNEIITDFCYFDDVLTQEEVSYINLNGISVAFGTVSSGIVGGYINGLGFASGIIGGYIRGSSIASGIIGAFISGSSRVSGIIGGYINARGLLSGIIGGYIEGNNTANTYIGSYITAVGLVSGLLGGFINGGLLGRIEFDGAFSVQARGASDYDSQIEIQKTNNTEFDAEVTIYQDELPPDISIIVPSTTVSGLQVPFNQYFIGRASGLQGKTITLAKWNFGDLTPDVVVSPSGGIYYPILHRFASSGFYNVRFSVIDSNGIHNSATRFVNAASGIDPVRIALSGIPRAGNAVLSVAFSQNYITIPNSVSIITSLLTYDDGQSTSTLGTTHDYTEPGSYIPVWVIRDSRGVIWSDSLEPGSDFDKANNQAGIP